MIERPSYLGVFVTFARNSLVRDMTFRVNFFLECISSMSWTAMQLGFYLIVFEHASQIGENTGWGRWQFFVFLGTTWLITSVVQTFFMPNIQEFSELIRTGNLDFALLKPIDTQFLISFTKVDWSSLSNFVMGLVLLGVSLWMLMSQPGSSFELEPWAVVLYPLYVFCGIVVMYSLMITLASTSIWLGRNQSLYDFWFYITNFGRYPMEIYQQGWGLPLWFLLTFIIPVLVAINVPARLLARPLAPREPWEWWLTGFALLATIGCVFASRRIFRWALLSYRSASS